MHAAIVGGGIGGLTAALCLDRIGWQVTVLERAPALEEVGAGLQLSPNGMKVLRALGLEDAVRAVAFRPERIALRMGRSGRHVFALPAGDWMERRYGAPYLVIHRADLLSVLAEAVGARTPGAVRTGADVATVDPDRSAVELVDGTTVTADLTIGADGLRSTLRRQIIGPDRPRYTGNLAWRAVVPREAIGDAEVPEDVTIWAGPGRHAVTYPLRQGALVNFVGIVESAEPPPESWTHGAPTTAAAADFAGWHPAIRSILESAGSVHQWALYDRPPISEPAHGATVLLGDSWHPMLPSMAQGACMAIEDAWVLADSLPVAAIPEALSRYAGLRAARTARVQRVAAGNLGLFHKRTILGQVLTYGPAWLAAQMAPWVLQRRTEWIYRHDVTDRSG